MRALIATKLGYFEEHRDFFRIYDSEVGRRLCRHNQHARQVEEWHLEQGKALDQVLQQAVRRKEIRPIRTEVAAFAILDIVRGLVSQRLRGSSRAPLDEDIACAFDLAWKGIGQR